MDEELWKTLAEDEEAEANRNTKEKGPKEVCNMNGAEKLKHVDENRRSLEDMQWDQDALEVPQSPQIRQKIS